MAALVATVALVSVPASSAIAQEEQTESAEATWAPSTEELDETLEKWLDDYVRYIITDPEKDIFEALEAPEQKLAFIDRFWLIRDPTPGTEENEYRQEHMQRFATATRRFHAGKPGWATDRGRIYILLGAPNQLQRNPMGRDGIERASEVWTYNFVDNPRLPATLDISFVDFHGTGEYEIVTYLDSSAPVWTEQFGYSHSNLDMYALSRHADTLYDEDFGTDRFRDPSLIGQDFLALNERLREFERVPEIHVDRLRDLRESVTTEVSFEVFPVISTVAFFEADTGETAVQLALGVAIDELASARVSSDRHFSADLYAGLERDGVVVDEREQRLNFRVTQEQSADLAGQQILQEFHLAALPGEYDLVLMARDNTSQQFGRTLQRIVVPELVGDNLRLSSVTLATEVNRVQSDENTAPEPFVHGDLRVIPNVTGVFFAEQNLFIYVQAYGLELDSETSTNRVSVRGRILRDEERFREIPEQHPYPAPMDRQSFTLGLPLSGFEPGGYRVEIEVSDDVSGEAVRASATFEIAG